MRVPGPSGLRGREGRGDQAGRRRHVVAGALCEILLGRIEQVARLLVGQQQGFYAAPELGSPAQASSR